ncbi:MAG TPA: DUF305 domain-containing protein [Rhodopila sp.]|uniref:CopM family metallochaperone n=1 Tax=Rhodopila sp. TaxID=2480087 RepID=UPI002BA4D3FB|nr:DUF305 domain-containing protein [Rhodopila sp.]HVY18051.1 DUF305 domain-containing protein [Rhodopila sp.]
MRYSTLSMGVLAACLAGGAALAQAPQPAPSAASPPPAAAPAPGAAESGFMTENDAAMRKMMADMSIKPTGNPDADFAAMMIPHHQGAIDMARAELRYGKDPELRRLARNIITDQQKEIALMRKVLAKIMPASAPARDGMHSMPMMSK